MDSSKISFTNDAAAKVKVIVANLLLGLNYKNLCHVRAANVAPEQQTLSRPETSDQGKKIRHILSAAKHANHSAYMDALFGLQQISQFCTRVMGIVPDLF